MKYDDNGEPLFTIDEIAQYISGWSMGTFDTVREIAKATLHNSLICLRCEQDGIEADTERAKLRKQNSDA